MRETAIFILFLLLASCAGRGGKERELLASMVGRQIVVPDSLDCRIRDVEIGCDMGDADYRIITYIDSAGCVPCRMKLSSWSEIINEYKGTSEYDVDFFMILNASLENRDLKITLDQSDFPYPILFDSKNEFRLRNGLPEDHQFHTMLLDLNNEIVAIGNPADSPKVRDLYKKILHGEDSRFDKIQLFCEKPVISLGLVNCGDTIVKEFLLRNNTSEMVTIQAVIPSCDCLDCFATTDTLFPGGSSTIIVKMVTDSIIGSFLKRVDIFYNEYEAKERITLCGFNYNQSFY